MAESDVLLVVKKVELDHIVSELASIKDIMTKKNEKELRPMSIKQLMEYLGKSRSTIFRYMDKHQMPYNRLGPDPVFYQADIEKWIKSSGSQTK